MEFETVSFFFFFVFSNFEKSQNYVCHAMNLPNCVAENAQLGQIRFKSDINEKRNCTIIKERKKKKDRGNQLGNSSDEVHEAPSDVKLASVGRNRRVTAAKSCAGVARDTRVC